MSLSIVFICLALVVGIYFYNNPLRHGPWFLSRRFINWFLLGMTYALNMYFQSYGAVSIIKVKAHWFHVRERGVFGAIFGTLISFGVYFAFDWGQAIINITKVNAPMPMSEMERWLRAIFVPPGLTMDATWA